MLQSQGRLAELTKQTETAERKLAASLLSIKLFWGPELEREKRLRLGERQRASKSEKLLKDQLDKGVLYMRKLTELQVRTVAATNACGRVALTRHFDGELPNLVRRGLRLRTKALKRPARNRPS